MLVKKCQSSSSVILPKIPELKDGEIWDNTTKSIISTEPETLMNDYSDLIPRTGDIWNIRPDDPSKIPFGIIADNKDRCCIITDVRDGWVKYDYGKGESESIFKDQIKEIPLFVQIWELQSRPGQKAKADLRFMDSCLKEIENLKKVKDEKALTTVLEKLYEMTALTEESIESLKQS